MQLQPVSSLQTDAAAILARLLANGVAAALDSELGGWWEGCPASSVAPLRDGRASVMVRDLNGTLLRLVPSIPGESALS